MAPRIDSTAKSALGRRVGARRRLDWVEWLRAFGCIAIVGMHVYVSLVNTVGVEALGPVRHTVEAVLSTALTRWAVPAFLMVSGMFLLDPEREVDSRRLWEHAKRLLFILATFGFAFCLIETVVSRGALSAEAVVEALVHLVTGQSWDHLWYIYALLGLYALTPLLRMLVAWLSGRDLSLVLLGAYVVVLVVPTVLTCWDIWIETPVNIVPATLYYLLGWYASHYLRPGRGVWLLGVVSLAAMLVATVQGQEILTLPEYCLVAPWGLLVFLLFREYATERLELHPLAELLASCSFGIYVIHPFFVHVVMRLVDPLAIPAGIFELATFCVALVGSVGLVMFLRRLPGFSRYL